MRCLDCRATIEEGSNFCRHCGASQYVEPPLQPQVSQLAPRSSLSGVSAAAPGQRKKFDWVLAAWGAFLVLFAVAAVTAKFSLSEKKRAERERMVALTAESRTATAESRKASAEASRALAEAKAVSDAMNAEANRTRAAAEAAVARVDGMAAERDMRAVQ